MSREIPPIHSIRPILSLSEEYVLQAMKCQNNRGLYLFSIGPDIELNCAVLISFDLARDEQVFINQIGIVRTALTDYFFAR
jgi:hypothetical protein